MATATAQPATFSGSGPASPGGVGLQTTNPVAALTPPVAPGSDGEWMGNAAVAALPVEVEVGVPVREFRVHNLLALEPGQIIESRWSHVDDVPLGAGKVQLAWSEFEVLDAQMAVRLTRLA